MEDPDEIFPYLFRHNQLHLLHLHLNKFQTAQACPKQTPDHPPLKQVHEGKVLAIKACGSEYAQSPCKKIQLWQWMLGITVLGGWTQADPWGACCQPALSISKLQTNETLSQKTRYIAPEKGHLGLTSGFSVNPYMYVPTCTHYKKRFGKLWVTEHAYNSSTQTAETRGFQV